MSEVKHTPGPWRVFNGTDIFPDDADTEGTRHIADCDMVNNISGDEARANAEFIVRACNSHYGLLDLAKLVHGSFGGGRVVTFSDEDIAAFNLAIAKAEGRS